MKLLLAMALVSTFSSMAMAETCGLKVKSYTVYDDGSIKFKASNASKTKSYMADSSSVAQAIIQAKASGSSICVSTLALKVISVSVE